MAEAHRPAPGPAVNEGNEGNGSRTAPRRRPSGPVPWEKAWQEALYGPAGFYRRPEGPAGHFRTASHAAPADLAAALHRLADDHGCRSIVDVGAGRGELLAALAAGPRRGDRVLWGADVVTRPAGLPRTVGWSQGFHRVPEQALAGALVIAWELLDVVPCPILELDSAGEPRTVLVDPLTGRERLGGEPSPAHLDWARIWWPPETPALAPTGDSSPEGDRIEVGAGRDHLWSVLVGRSLAAGARAVLAVDYAHQRPDRPTLGSLTGFRTGRAVPPVPDGSMDLTAHVAVDAVAAAGRTAGATRTHLTTQSTALAALGTHTPELLDPCALGSFAWLLQTP